MNTFVVLGQFVTWALVIWGWSVIRARAQEREDRSEAREILINFTKLVREVEENSHTYWTENPDTPTSKKLEFDIKIKLKRLPLLLNILKIRKKSFNLRRNLKSFRQANTSKPFQTNEKTKLNFDDMRLHLISYEANLLVEEIEKKFYEAYCK